MTPSPPPAFPVEPKSFIREIHISASLVAALLVNAAIVLVALPKVSRPLTLTRG